MTKVNHDFCYQFVQVAYAYHILLTSTSLKSIEPQLYFNGQLTVKDPHLYSYLCQKFYLIIMLSFICRWHIEQQVKYRCLKWTKYRTTDPTYCENYNLWIDSVTKTFSGMLVLLKADYRINSLSRGDLVEGWKQNGSKCYWITKQIKPFHIHPSL